MNSKNNYCHNKCTRCEVCYENQKRAQENSVLERRNARRKECARLIMESTPAIIALDLCNIITDYTMFNPLTLKRGEFVIYHCSCGCRSEAVFDSYWTNLICFKRAGEKDVVLIFGANSPYSLERSISASSDKLFESPASECWNKKNEFPTCYCLRRWQE